MKGRYGPEGGCISSCCRYSKRQGQVVNGPCRCDECPKCGKRYRPDQTNQHREWCTYEKRKRSVQS